ncbi:hypothetical protein FNJ59_05610 [Bacteroides pyogenes]|nr:hypothetical protein FNJ59_05610 [Bacteroides pyogenes]
MERKHTGTITIQTVGPNKLNDGRSRFRLPIRAKKAVKNLSYPTIRSKQYRRSLVSPMGN